MADKYRAAKSAGGRKGGKARPSMRKKVSKKKGTKSGGGRKGGKSRPSLKKGKSKKS